MDNNPVTFATEMKERDILKNHSASLRNFYVAGISYKTAAIDVREKYSIGPEILEQVYHKLGDAGATAAMVTSTCNRTEAYFFVQHPDHAQDVVRAFVACGRGTESELRQRGFILNGEAALRHLMRVSVGLESQIPGDFEIIGQVKKSFLSGRKHEATNGLLERMVNSAIHASRRVKNETGFSTGASSVSYACVRYMRDEVPNLEDKKILIYGMGKMGRIALENILKHVGAHQITLLNRTDKKSFVHAERYGVNAMPHENRGQAFRESDIIIVATGAPAPIIFKNDLSPVRAYWVLDLSVPSNVAADVAEEGRVSVMDVDRLSQITRETIDLRKEQMPGVEAIVENEINEFLMWHHKRELAQLAGQMRDAIEEISTSVLKTSGLNGQSTELAQKIAEAYRENLFNTLRHQVQNEKDLAFLKLLAQA